MKVWDFYETFRTREEAQQFKRENKGRKTSRIEEILTIIGMNDNGPVYGFMYQVGGDYLF